MVLLCCISVTVLDTTNTESLDWVTYFKGESDGRRGVSPSLTLYKSADTCIICSCEFDDDDVNYDDDYSDHDHLRDVVNYNNL